MEREEVVNALESALRQLKDKDSHLLENDLSERCIAARLAMYLQPLFPEHAVDVEYNRQGDIPKRLGLPDECANYRNRDGESLAVPDVIVHRRGPDGPNVLVVELKKTSNREGPACDQLRIRAFREQLRYEFGALIECETRGGHPADAKITEWLGG